MRAEAIQEIRRQFFHKKRVAPLPQKKSLPAEIVFLVPAIFFFGLGGMVATNVSLAEIALAAGLAGLCTVPIVKWYQLGMNWLPLGEIYILIHLVFYMLPCLSERPDWMIFPEDYRVASILVVIVFVASVLLTYQTVLRSTWPPLEQAGLFRREIREDVIWGMFGLWVAGCVALKFTLLPGMGDFMNVFRSAMTAAGGMGIIYLFYQEGQGLFSLWPRIALYGGMTLGLATSFANGFLSGTAEFIGVAMLAYSMGSKRIPIKTLVCSIALLAVLQMGKDGFRKAYWGKNLNYSEQSVSLVDGYQTWLNEAWKSSQGGKDHQNSLLQRASLIQVLGIAVCQFPEQESFWGGDTYALTPLLLVPRFLWPDKPPGSFPTELIGIDLGIQTVQGAKVTGVTVGPIVEAWCNFGWIGAIVAGAFFGLLFGLAARFSFKLVPRQIGWLLASVYLVYSVSPAYTVPEIICSLLQALIVAFAFLYIVSLPPGGISKEEQMARNRKMVRSLSSRRAAREQSLKQK